MPEDFVKGDVLGRGKIDVVAHERFNNRGDVASFVARVLAEQEKGIEPKEVEEWTPE